MRPALPCVYQLWAAAGIKDPSYVLGKHGQGLSCYAYTHGAPLGLGGAGHRGASGFCDFEPAAF
jgi:hypothetical protein